MQNRMPIQHVRWVCARRHEVPGPAGIGGLDSLRGNLLASRSECQTVRQPRDKRVRAATEVRFHGLLDSSPFSSSVYLSTDMPGQVHGHGSQQLSRVNDRETRCLRTASPRHGCEDNPASPRGVAFQASQPLLPTSLDSPTVDGYSPSKIPCRINCGEVG
ncbi:hypothetical protein LY78DRAFT_266914 [Colletotrichum sublineola]|nr:hypothetical protein LY78DRAFT_266914 [Colletotrichum sublineola]